GDPLAFFTAAGWCPRPRLELDAVEVGPRVQRRDRLLAVRAVVVDERDLLTLELVETTELLGDVLDGDVGCRPIAAKGNEVPGEHRTIPALGTAVAGRQQRDLVAGHLFGQREGDARRQRREIAGAGRSLALQALIAFNALVGGVAGLAFLEGDLDAVDAPVALLHYPPLVCD